MDTLAEQLESDALILAIIDQRRAQTGMPSLGSAIESVILNRWLSRVSSASEQHQCQSRSQKSREYRFCE